MRNGDYVVGITANSKREILHFGILFDRFRGTLIMRDITGQILGFHKSSLRPATPIEVAKIRFALDK